MTKPLYLEIDEDITSAIDKMLKLEADEVAIVVPKRSTLLQSLVNLKLLKKAADDDKKRLVLVTSDKTATHLAGRVGLPVATSLKAEAHVPDMDVKEPEATSEISEETPTAPLAAASAATVAKGAKSVAKDETPAAADEAPVVTSRPVDDSDPALGDIMDEPQAKTAKSKSKTKRVPDYNALQRWLIWLGIALALVLAFIVFNFFFSKASVTLYAKADQTPVKFDFSVDPNAASSDFAAAKLAGQTLSETKNLTSTFKATGQQDIGTKASGTVTVTNYCYNPGTLPAGTTFTSGGLGFVSTQAVAIPDATLHAGSCNSPSTAAVPVAATQNGDKYNLAPATYAVANYSASQLKGTGNQMSGGTSKIQTVVTQADFDAAKKALLDKNKDAVQKELEAKAAATQKPIGASFAPNVTSAASDPAVGAQADQATLTMAVTYTELTVSKTDFDKLLTTQGQKQIGATNQIYDNGAEAAQITLATGQTFHLSTNAYSGVKIDTVALAKQLAGQRYGDALDTAQKTPGVDHATINLWPFWVSKVPHHTGNIHVIIKASGTGGN